MVNQEAAAASTIETTVQKAEQRQQRALDGIQDVQVGAQACSTPTGRSPTISGAVSTRRCVF